MNKQKDKCFFLSLIFTIGFILFLSACGSSADGNRTDSDNISKEQTLKTNDAQSDSDDEVRDGGLSDLPRFITDPNGTFNFNDMIPHIATYEVVKDGATYRIELVGEEEVDGETLEKFHYVTDDADTPEEYADFHVWLDKGGFGIKAISATGEELPIQTAHGFAMETIREMVNFGFYYRDQLIDGDTELISYESANDTLLEYDVEVHYVEIYEEEYDDIYKFTIAEGDVFEVILNKETSGSFEDYEEIEIKEMTLR